MYLINGLNVTGLRYGNLESGAATIGGGSNIPIEFLTQIDVNSGGYQAEYGGAMGGVVNTVLMAGSNEWKGSAFLYWSPYWLAADPKVVIPVDSSLTGVRKPDFDDSFGVEVGGPLIKDKLFLWVGFAPRITNSHVLRYTYAQTEATDPLTGMPTGKAVLDAAGAPVVHQLPDWTARIPETHRTYFYAANVDFIPRPDNKLTLTLVGTPSFNNELKNQYGLNSLASDPRDAVEELTKVNTDVNAHWTSKLLDRRWQIDAMAGMHNEYFYDRSPYDDLNNLNELEYGGADLSMMEHTPGCENNPATGFIACPVNPYYQTGGFGLISKSSAYRWSGDIKSTNIFEAGGHNELKYGWHLDYNTLDLSRHYSGGAFEQAFFANNQQGLPPGIYNTTTYFSLPPGVLPVEYTTGIRPLSELQPGGMYAKASLDTAVSSLANAFFLQDSYSPNGLRNLTVNAGLRLELQRLNDLNGNPFLNTDDLAPRLSAVYDPLNDGRSKIAVSYGRYYQAIPMDVAARYFSGENFIQTFGFASTCPPGLQNPATWAGKNESQQCTMPLGANPTFNNAYAQANIQGQYNNEITATAERELMEGMTLRLDYQHRWLGNIIEDGYGPGFANNVLANPGNVPQSAIDTAQNQVNAAQAAVNANPADPAVAAQAAAQLAAAQYNLGTLQTLKNAPPPERTYDAITLSLNQRFTKNWFARASYTYSRLIGNYEGLYQTETNYIAPNGNNFYDAPELYINQNGPLPNDRPHILHLDGFYSHEIGRGRLTLGLSFTARSGQPRNYIGNLEPGTGYQVVMLLPRGSGGRTPTVTELNGKIAYGRPLGPRMNLEGFIDLFNIFNQQTAVITDDNYTFDAAPPIVNGTPSDLKFAKSVSGQPIGKNPNYGQPLAYQAPFNARLGLRLTF
jgi:hypothetical protein